MDWVAILVIIGFIVGAGIIQVVVRNYIYKNLDN